VTRNRTSTTARRLTFRLIAVVLGLALFGLFEGALRLWGRNESSARVDPFVGFRSVDPLFRRDSGGDRFQIAPSRLNFFCPDSFAANKRPDEYRIFCLGGSTVQGRPFAVETSFTTWLEIGLRAADTSRHWDVVNCGGISYASYRLVPVLQEVLGYRPDLIIVYTGHNEFLEDRTYSHIKLQPKLVRQSLTVASRLRTYQLLATGYQRLVRRRANDLLSGRPILSSEVDALLDYRGGLEQYHHDPKWRADVIDHYRFNLRRMVQLAQDADVPMLLVNPVCNLRDCAPFKSQNRDGLSTEQLQRWEQCWSEARTRYATNKIHSIDWFRRAIELDDQHAGIHFALAKCYDDAGMMEKAYTAYLQAKELDICPLRILEPMNEAVILVARQTDTPLVDARLLFESHSKDGIPGADWLIDHVHPSIDGHKLIADALIQEFHELGIVQLPSDWSKRKQVAYSAHLSSLGDHYYLKGMERLRGVRDWARGRAERLRPEKEDRDG
jgi:lysophospholipase L1-like esterase